MATIGNLVANLALNSASFSRGFGVATRDLNSFSARSFINLAASGRRLETLETPLGDENSPSCRPIGKCGKHLPHCPLITT